MNFFVAHLNKVGEGYFKHMWFAFLFGFWMIIAGVFLLIHSVFPFIFANVGSDILLKLSNRFIDRMPQADERVKKLNQSIQRKLSTEL